MKQVREISVRFNYRQLSMEQTDVSPMDLLVQGLKSNFPEIIGIWVSAGNEFFEISIAEGTEAAKFMKAFDGFVKEYIQAYGDAETEYDFRINRGRQLINIMSYNSDRGYLVDVRLNGNMQTLFVVDVQGATGDYTVFNDDFQTVGFMNMRDTRDALTEPDYGDDQSQANFGDSSLWEASNTELSSVLKEIVEQISSQLENEDHMELE